MTGYIVNVPEESYQILEFIQDDLPGVAIINAGLKTFEPKIVFNWHLSLIMDLKQLVENGMPSKEEQMIIDNFGDILDTNIKGSNKAKPNAVFLARITWNKTRELIWRVHDAKSANDYLRQIISQDISPRTFDYRIEQDNEWKLAEWHLQHWN